MGEIDGVECLMDDILIHAKNSEDLQKITDVVVNRILSAGLKLNREVFLINQV